MSEQAYMTYADVALRYAMQRQAALDAMNKRKRTQKGK